MNLHDSTIAHIAKIIQLAMITGTDIIDHLRMIKLSANNDDNMIYIDKEYESNHNISINELIKEASKTRIVDE